MSEVKQRIIEVMAAVFEMDAKNIPNNAAPGVIGRWDSIRHMNLVLALEEEFSVRFPDEQLEQLINIELIELSINELTS